MSMVTSARSCKSDPVPLAVPVSTAVDVNEDDEVNADVRSVMRSLSRSGHAKVRNIHYYFIIGCIDMGYHRTGVSVCCRCVREPKC